MKTRITLMVAAAALLCSCTQADWDEISNRMKFPSSVESAHVAS